MLLPCIKSNMQISWMCISPFASSVCVVVVGLGHTDGAAPGSSEGRVVSALRP